MSLPTLMVFPGEDAASRNVFSFEHAMAHRALMAVMGPLDQWSLMPYWIDPTIYNAAPATNWNMNHHQAHGDFTHYLPAYVTAASGAIGIPTDKNMKEGFGQGPGGVRSWWTHNNHMEHLIAANAVTSPTTGPQPWWAQAPRRVQNFW